MWWFKCLINIQCPDGTILKLSVDPDDPLSFIKKGIEYKGNSLGKTYPEDKQILYFNNNELINNDATLISYGIKN